MRGFTAPKAVFLGLLLVTSEIDLNLVHWARKGIQFSGTIDT